MTSIMTGGKAAGMAEEASNTLRTVLRARGWPLPAVAPMFQMTGCYVSRSVVAASSRRPDWSARAMPASIRGIDIVRDQSRTAAN
jgi:hypothetical protein